MYKVILSAAIFSLSTLAYAHNVDATVSASKEGAASEEVNISADKAEAVLVKTNCIRETGTRIKRAKDKKDCNGLPGRSYDKDDIDRTGALSIGEALERLDPSVRISR